MVPTAAQLSGGVVMLFEFANSMARRGHEVHFIHGPATPQRIDRLEDVPFDFAPMISHHIVDRIDDPALPHGDVVFHSDAPRRLGQPLAVIQGFRLIGPAWDAYAYRARCPKICVASWLVDVGLSFGAPPEQLVHIPLGLHHDVFQVRHAWSDRDLDVAMLYHPYREKGWDVGSATLERLSHLRPDLRAVVFSLAGPPPGRLPDGVELALDLSQQQLVQQVYDRTRVFVQASHHEGFGLTPVEAMACGAALVTTDCGGSRDYAVPGETAVVVPPGNPETLATAASGLLDDPTRAGRIASRGTAFVQRFDWARTAELLTSFLERYLADPTRYQAPPGEDRSADFVL